MANTKAAISIFIVILAVVFNAGNTATASQIDGNETEFVSNKVNGVATKISGNLQRELSKAGKASEHVMTVYGNKAGKASEPRKPEKNDEPEKRYHGPPSPPIDGNYRHDDAYQQDDGQRDDDSNLSIDAEDENVNDNIAADFSEGHELSGNGYYGNSGKLMKHEWSDDGFGDDGYEYGNDDDDNEWSGDNHGDDDDDDGHPDDDDHQFGWLDDGHNVHDKSGKGHKSMKGGKSGKGHKSSKTAPKSKGGKSRHHQTHPPHSWWGGSKSPTVLEPLSPTVAPTPCGKAGKDCPTETNPPASFPEPTAAPTPCGKAGKLCETKPPAIPSVPPTMSPVSSLLPPTMPPYLSPPATPAPSAQAQLPVPQPVVTVPPILPSPTIPPVTSLPPPIMPPVTMPPITVSPVSSPGKTDPTYSPLSAWPTYNPTVPTIESLTTSGSWFQSGKAYTIETSYTRRKNDPNDIGFSFIQEDVANSSIRLSVQQLQFFGVMSLILVLQHCLG